MYDVLKSSYREISVQVPVRLDDGRLLVTTGYRVQHNGARGPYKGGIPAQNVQQFRWNESRCNEELEDAMVRAFEVTATMSEHSGITLRRAAYAIGIERVARAVRLRGYV
ncbi:MAG: hypothetical protein C4344_02065 [Acidimicrobiia bacterium]